MSGAAWEGDPAEEVLALGLIAGFVGVVACVLILAAARHRTPINPPPIAPPAQYRCFPEDVRQGVEIGMCPDARNHRMMEV